MLSRLLTAALLPITPLLLACGSWGELVIENDAEEQILLTICDAEQSLELPDCDTLKTQLESGKTIVVSDGWFNSYLAGPFAQDPDWEQNLAEWLVRSRNGLIVNRISMGPEPDQWLVELWLHRDGELRPITDTFERFTDDFWEILYESIYLEAVGIPEVVSESRRLPIDWAALAAPQRLQLTKSITDRTLLELFQGNQLVFNGSLRVRPRITRGCADGLEQVFQAVESEPQNPADAIESKYDSNHENRP